MGARVLLGHALSFAAWVTAHNLFLVVLRWLEAHTVFGVIAWQIGALKVLAVFLVFLFDLA